MEKGLTVPEVLFLVFLVLRLTGLIHWSWWWVTSPLWITAILIIIAVIIQKIKDKKDGY
jgi:hypothetical protein